MIAQFNGDGDLPRGIHQTTWEEFVERFGTNHYRMRMIRGLKSAIDNLKSAGCKKIYVDGSFVTSKRRPHDFDACWDPTDVEYARLDPVLTDLTNGRKSQKTKYYGELFPTTNNSGRGDTILEFFQQNRESGSPKGIVCIELGDSS